MLRTLLKVFALSMFLWLCSFMAQAGQESQPKRQTLEDIDRLQEMDKLKRKLDQMQKKGEEVDAIFYFHCLKAIANEKYCTCLQDNRPWIVDFRGYVTIVTSTKEELHYATLDKEIKVLIDATYQAREICAARNLCK